MSKGVLSAIALPIVLASCMSAAVKVNRTDYTIGAEKAAAVGSVMTLRSTGYGYGQFFDQQLIYAGISGSTIHISYRELSRGFARPAFNQELVYDVAQSRIIGFQGMEIEILSADAREVHFIVRRDPPPEPEAKD